MHRQKNSDFGADISLQGRETLGFLAGASVAAMPGTAVMGAEIDIFLGVQG